jgi:hypothetical protein
MFQNPYLNHNEVYSGFKLGFNIVWNWKQKIKTKYNVLKIVPFHQKNSAYSSISFNNKNTIQVILQNSKLFQCHSQFLAMKTNSKCSVFSPNQPNLILPYSDNTCLSTLSYNDHTCMPLIQWASPQYNEPHPTPLFF